MASQNGIDNQITDNDFTVTNNDCGATAFISCTNSCTDASSDSVIEAVVASATAGDPFINFEVSGVTDWSLGIDNSVTTPAADPFLISANSALGTNTVMTAQTTGEINLPLQPSFLTTISANGPNTTGDGTNINPVPFDTEIKDIGGNFNTGTYIFTAPVSGTYSFYCLVYRWATGTSTTFSLEITTSNLSYQYSENGSPNSNGDQTMTISAIADMDASDTAKVQFVASGGTKNVGYFSGLGFGGQLLS